ncbi:MAG: Unknown protein [uncultured Sulfurovum sp.]|uniref:Histidine Kinase domain-containing protein n=1 Tax=uncultured Sulfurovum sp. TaxID=269237 RepID=A0A6S6SC08_9BACT|nr:MAG: Unknown protein [uncultured Sulfurovum sp.]
MEEQNTQTVENKNLILAIKDGNLEDIKKAVENGADIEVLDEEGNTPLIQSLNYIRELPINEQDFNIISFLIKSGANVNPIHDDSLLILLCTFCEIKLVKLLIKKGTNVNVIDSDGISPLTGVIMSHFIFQQSNMKVFIRDEKKYQKNIEKNQKNIIELLIKNGANTNIKLKNLSILCFACMLSNIEIIELLIKNGADVNVLINGVPSLLIASLFGDLEIVELLLKNDVKALSEENISSVLLLNKQLFNLLNKDNLQFQVFFGDFDKNRLEIVKLLINDGTDVNDILLSAIAMYSMKYKIEEKREYINNSELSFSEKVKSILFINNTLVDIKLSTIAFLLENGANINKINESIHHPLYNAIRHDDLALVKLLVNHMNNINLYLDKTKTFPFFFKALEKGNYEIIELLLQRGMDINTKEAYGNTPLFYAIENDDLKLVQLLIKEKADVNLLNDLLAKVSPLLLAVYLNRIEIAKLLIENGADINFQCDIHLESEDDFISVYALANEHDDQILADYLETKGIETNLLSSDTHLMDTMDIIVKPTIFFNRKEKKPNSSIKSIEDINQEIETYKCENGKYSKDMIELLEINKESKIELENLKKSNLDRTKNQEFNEIIEKAIDTKSKENLQELLDLDFILTDININDLFIENFPSEFIMEVVRQTENVNILTEEGMTPLMYACGLDDFNLVELLLAKGADKTTKNNMGERAKDFTTNKELRLFLANYVIKKSNPEKLVSILTNFTIDTPIKYTTHEWRNRIDAKYFDNFDLFLEDISEQFKTLGSELKVLSPNLYHKVEAFIVSTENSNSWKSMKDLKPWVESKKEPFDFPIANENILFKMIIESFKNEIEIRGNMLQEIFLEHKKRLGRAFKITISDNLKGEKFYTDVETFKNAVDEIFREIEKYAKEQNEYEIEVELFKPENNFRELHIIHVGSTSTREAIELLDRIKQEKGDSVLRGYFENLCDWEIKASHKNNHFTIDCFNEEIKNIEKPKGFTHIMRFYK